MPTTEIIITLIALMIIIGTVAWDIIFSIRDYRNRSENGVVVTNLKIAVRNMQAACVFLTMTLALKIWEVFFK